MRTRKIAFEINWPLLPPPEFSDLPTALADGHHSLGETGEAGNLVSQDRQQQHHHSYVGVLQRPRERFQSSVHGGQNLGITKSLEAAAEHEVFVTLMRAEHLGSFWRDFCLVNIFLHTKFCLFSTVH